jgi:uncharacterized protein involved in exopolysaccharide biosynthesis
LLLASTLAGTLIGIGLALHAKPFYVASAVFLPPRTTEVLAASTQSLFGSTDNSDIYLGLLASRTLQDDVIQHLDLMKVYGTTLHVDAENALAGASSFALTKNSLITVSVRANEPQLAADIANTYLDALYRLNGDMLKSGSSHREDFLKQQVADQKILVDKAEDDLKETQIRTGVTLPTGEASAALSTTTNLQAQIDAANARIAGLLTGATEANPEVIAARNELRQLQAELARQQSAASSGGIAGNRQIPALTLELAQKTREAALRTSVYESLVQQYERARLSAIDPGSQLQIVDRAVVPERKAGPAKKQYVVYGFLLGLIGGLLFLFGYAPLRRFIRILRQPDTLGPI